jgi:hypothetical protein
MRSLIKGHFGTDIGTKRATQPCKPSRVEHLPMNSVPQSRWRHRFKKAVNAISARLISARCAQGVAHIDAFMRGAATNRRPTGRQP